MKKLFFSIVILVTLVIATGTAMAQSTARIPYIGTEHIYSWPVKDVTTYSFIVNTDPADRANGVVTNDVYSVNTNDALSGGAIANGNASVRLTWLPASNNNTYYVWLVANSASGCTTYKRLTVIPKSFDVIIADISSTFQNLTNWTAAGASDPSTCPSNPVDPNTDAFDAGSSTLYFRVIRTSNGTVPLNINENWTFTLALEDNQATSYAAPTVTVYDGDNNVITSAGSGVYNVSTESLTNRAYALVKLVYANETYANGAPLTEFKATITSASTGGSLEVTPASTNLNVATHSLKAVPTIGAFSGN